jgi:hypothetical protein
MITNNLTLYRLLVKFGASEVDAEAAANVDTSALATKADLADLKAELTWRFIVVMGAQTAIFSAIVAALKFVN